MNLTSPKTIKELLTKHETKASKGLGQNFLIDKNVLEKIVRSADIKPDDIILEVGPGIGTLTQELAKKAKQVIAVEKSETMVKILAETLKDYKNIKIENCDILEFIENCKLKIVNYKVVANIPYYLTSPLIRFLLENENPPSEIILMVQKEVAQRICSKPPKMSLLAVSVQFYAEPKIISYVSKSCFLPAPKIDSAIIKITPHTPVIASLPAGRQGAMATKQSRTREQELFFKIVKAGFSHPRKQLANNFITTLKLDRKSVEEWLKKNNIKSTQRAETLRIEDWKNLADSL